MFFLGIIVILYFFIIILFFIGFLRIPVFNKKSDVYEKISIIVAAKNEEENIKNIIDDIMYQNYPNEFYELIIIDDNSVDKTFENAIQHTLNYKNIKVVKLQNFKGKKNAIKKGIEISDGNLIITTDADCSVNENWLLTINNFYQVTKAKMIIAPVKFDTDKKILSLKNFLALEFLSLQATTAGSVGINSPIMCNGANLIYEKKIFYEFQNPLNDLIESGDDMFFMMKVKKKYHNQIKYLKNIDAVVTTKAPDTLKNFWNQRIRWSSKAKFYKDFFVNFTALLTFLTSFVLLFSFIGAISGVFSWMYFIVFFVLKTLADLPLLLFFSSFIKNKKIMYLFFFLQFFYFFYVFIIAFFSLFIKYKWK